MVFQWHVSLIELKFYILYHQQMIILLCLVIPDVVLCLHHKRAEQLNLRRVCMMHLADLRVKKLVDLALGLG